MAESNQPVMVVTGTSKGIGRWIVDYYLSRGYLVAGCSRGPSSIFDESYMHSIVDIGSELEVRRWIRAVKNTYKRIDVLICNAGYAPANLLLAMTSGDVLDKVIRSNIAGSYFVCREVSKVMMQQRNGRIITTSSMAVGLHEVGTSAYSASKSAIVEITKILAKELAPLNITCNVIAPSILMTDAVEKLGIDIVNRVFDNLTIKRPLSVEDICNVINFYVAPESSCITGQVIHMGLVC